MAPITGPRADPVRLPAAVAHRRPQLRRTRPARQVRRVFRSAAETVFRPGFSVRTDRPRLLKRGREVRRALRALPGNAEETRIALAISSGTSERGGGRGT